MNRGALFAALARRMACFLTALLLLLGASRSYSANFTWTSGQTGNWSVTGASGWTGAAYPNAVDAAGQYTSTSASGVTTLNLSGITVGSLQITGGLNSRTWTINTDASNYGLTMQVGSGSASITAANSNTITINPALTLNSDLAVTTTTAATASATAITLNGAVTGSANVTLSANNSGNNTSGVPYATITVANLNNSGTVTVDGNIGTGNTTLSKTFITSIGSNVSGLTKTGTGSLQVNGGTLSGTVTGASAQTITKGGNSAVLTVSGNNSSTFDGLWVATSSLATDFGSLKFSSSNAIGTSNAKIATSAGGIVVAGYAIDQAFVDRFTTATVNGQAASASGVIALGADSSNNIDMRGTSGLLANSMYLGAVGTATYSGTLTPNGTAYLLGGSTGRLILTASNSFTGARSVSIGLTVASNSQQAGSIIQMAADQNYTGGTTLNSGTLSVSHLANGNSTSGIGASSSVAANLVFATVSTGPTATLEYTGAGDTTNRLFSLQNSRTGGGILNNGTGALTFSNNGTIVINSGNSTALKTVTLGGSNTADNTFAPKLADVPTATAQGAVSFVKQDAGKWILTNANTYTGTTAVNVGTLLVNGNQASATGNVSVASGAILGGTGTLGGATTVNGILAPGSGGIGTLNIAANATWAGAASAGSATDWVFDLGASNTADKLAITGNFNKDTTLGTAFRFDFGGSTQLGTFTLATWTGTTGFSSGDFSYTNLGGGDTGSFNISGTSLQFIATVPEPATWALMAFSLTAVAVLRRRRNS